ncbi:hypothetical protein HMPREF9944_00723 [Segatella maculosa OT 289]|uniref:Uncharacterized protein n=1 Tax=Segatella maculosa OT 289 TaxID=999422 RepID=H1HKM9_9BACT|nr:hypothetical protein HMPREF9944_00723 [Segatella maculosa OT 289]
MIILYKVLRRISIFKTKDHFSRNTTVLSLVCKLFSINLLHNLQEIEA